MKHTYKAVRGLYPRRGVVVPDHSCMIYLMVFAGAALELVMFVRWWMV